MRIEILGAESLGVRGLCCLIELKHRKILIDPGIALGWSRHGLLPHPFQVALGAGVREKIIRALRGADDVIISHFDGDHCPLQDPNPYQLGLDTVVNSLTRCRIWTRGPEKSSPVQRKRRNDLAVAIGRELKSAEGLKTECLEFSPPVPHGKRHGGENLLMMSLVREGEESFVHASDIQLLEDNALDIILGWQPDVVLVSGPPLYHYSGPAFDGLWKKAFQNAQRLSASVGTLIIDHHLLRSDAGRDWLKVLKQSCKNEVCCAAEYMDRQAVFLETWREELYKRLPVDQAWHDMYRQGRVEFTPYRTGGWQALIEAKRIQPCKWYSGCPVKADTDRGKLDRYWIEEYCLVANKSCIRYQMAEKGEYLPDDVLPDGRTRDRIY